MRVMAVLARPWAPHRATGEGPGLLHAMAENSAGGIVGTDLEGRITYFSSGAVEIFGLPAAEAYGRSLHTFLTLLGGDVGRVVEGVSAGNRFRDEDATLTRADGHVAEVGVSFSPVRRGEGRVVGMLAMVGDKTESRRLEAQLRQAQKMEVVRRLAGGVAHDFNNLLTVIMSHAEALGEELPADHPLREHVELIEQAAGRAATLTRQLLAFSRKEVLQPARLRDAGGRRTGLGAHARRGR